MQRLERKMQQWEHETSEKSTAIIQTTDDGGMNQHKGGSEKWPTSRCILKTELTFVLWTKCRI